MTMSESDLRRKRVERSQGELLTRILQSIPISRLHFMATAPELGDVVSIVHTSIGGTRIVGRIAAGDHHGHLVPSTTTDQELQHLQNALPADDRPRRVLTVQS
ncbi:hypothetical protein BC826DRAFT_1054212 [Russula brevipes]|nr:hypothetical protein BC826DRAFT_1054212 [Russula brevipes]